MDHLVIGIIAVIEKIPIRKVVKIYDQELTYIFIFQLIGFVVTIITIYIFLKKEQLNLLDIGLRFQHKGSIYQGFIFGAIPVVLVAVSLSSVNEIHLTQNYFRLGNFLLYFSMLILGAFNEELLMRGYVLRYLMSKKNKYVALILSSILFATFHLSNDNITAISLINIFLAGIFFGVFFIYFKNLWFSIAAHFAWNFFEGPVLGSPISGLKTDSFLKQSLIGTELFTGGKFGFEASIMSTVVLIAFIYILYLFCENQTKHKIKMLNVQQA